MATQSLPTIATQAPPSEEALAEFCIAIFVRSRYVWGRTDGEGGALADELAMLSIYFGIDEGAHHFRSFIL